MSSGTLRSALDDLATRFADGVLAAIRTASIDELQAEAGGRRIRGGRGAGQPVPSARAATRRSGRLPRRSPEQIATTLGRVVALVKASRGKGLRAEQIKAALKLDRRELPRVLHEGVRKKVLRATGQKRATTYFLAGAGAVAAKTAPRASKKRPKRTRKK